MEKLPQIIEQNGKKAVSALELYTSLGYDQTNWVRWYKKNILNNEFAALHEDYTHLVFETSTAKTKDFALSIDFAKKLAMMARTEQGERVRTYFIQCEEALKQVVSAPLPQASPAEMLLMMAQQAVEQERQLKLQDKRIASVEQDIKEIKLKAETSPNCYAVMGYAILNGYSVSLQTASKLGAAAARMCKSRNIEVTKIPDPRFGKVGQYPIEILKEVFAQHYHN